MAEIGEALAQQTEKEAKMSGIEKLTTFLRKRAEELAAKLGMVTPAQKAANQVTAEVVKRKEEANPQQSD